ncbi:MAG: PAS domain S-box protein [Bacteroidales bacterium]|nr:PAS domain S-box protein [Bacteroidales bacterium]
MNLINLDIFSESDLAITACDKNFIIIYMNEKAKKTFANYGGENLIGRSLLECHPESARKMLKEFMLTGEKNSYTIEKNGIKKIILQRPWFTNSELMGYLEFSFEIPFEMNHFVRN